MWMKSPWPGQEAAWRADLDSEAGDTSPLRTAAASSPDMRSSTSGSCAHHMTHRFAR